MATVTSTDHILTPEAKEIHPLHCEMGEWENGRMGMRNGIRVWEWKYGRIWSERVNGILYPDFS